MNQHRIMGLKWTNCLVCFALLWVLFLAACSGNNNQLGTGSIAFKAVFLSPDSDISHIRAAGEIDVCSEYGIQTIAARVIDSGGDTQGEGTWPCATEGHRGAIEQVPPGSGYRVVVEGIISDITAWRGEIANLTVAAGETTHAGSVEMTLVGQFALSASAGSGGTI